VDTIFHKAFDKEHHVQWHFLQCKKGKENKEREIDKDESNFNNKKE